MPKQSLNAKVRSCSIAHLAFDKSCAWSFEILMEGFKLTFEPLNVAAVAVCGYYK